MKEFFKKYRIGTKLLALLFATLLWAAVTVINNPSVDVPVAGVPVELLGQDTLLTKENLVVSEIDVDAVSVTVTGTFRSSLRVSADSITVRADVSEYSEPGTYSLGYDVSLPNGLAVKYRSPAAIPIVIEEIVEKELPVRLEYEGELPSGVILDEALLEPQTVWVSGTSSVMEKAAYAVVTLDSTLLTTDFSAPCSYHITDADGVILESEHTRYLDRTVQVDITAYLVKTVPFDATISTSSGVAKNSVQTRFYPSEVTIYGRAADIQEIRSLNIGAIDVKEFILEYEKTFDVVLPEGAFFYDEPVENVEVHVDLLDVDTKEITVNQVVLTGIPEDTVYTVTAETESLNVLVRCDRSKIKNIDPDNFKVNVDLTEFDLTPGRHVVPAVVRSSVGGYDVCGEYSVVILVSESMSAEDGSVSEER